VLPYADYEQWERACRATTPQSPARPVPGGKPTRSSDRESRPRKLGYREQREWDEMEARILDAEARLEACRLAAQDPSVATDHQALSDRLEALAGAQAEVDRLYARWAELESRVRG